MQDPYYLVREEIQESVRARTHVACTQCVHAPCALLTCTSSCTWTPSRRAGVGAAPAVRGKPPLGVALPAPAAAQVNKLHASYERWDRLPQGSPMRASVAKELARARR